MLYLIIALLIIALLTGPQLWVHWVIERNNKAATDIKGTGGEFARHLINKLGLEDEIKVEETEQGNHYSPNDKAVRLNKSQYQTRSLSAMVIAAHEVGHAIQDKENYHWMRRQQRLAILAHGVSIIAPVALAVSPILLLFTRSPALSALTLLLGIGSMALNVIVQLMTLPVETDASFQKALPILEQGGYLQGEKQHRQARRILQAAAMTYVAAALYQMLNFSYWLRLLRR